MKNCGMCVMEVQNGKIEILEEGKIYYDPALFEWGEFWIYTSELFTGRYRIKIVLNNEEFLLEDRFRVILIAC